MATTITAGNATNGAAVASDNTGILELKTGTGSGTTALTLNASQNATLAGTLSVGAVTSTGLVTGATGALYPLVSGTAITLTNQTAPEFTGIPSWAKRITVMFDGISNATSSVYIQLQLGTTSGYEIANYLGACGVLISSSYGSAATTTGFNLAGTGTEINGFYSGAVVLTTMGSNTWVIQGGLGSTLNARAFYPTGSKTLGGALDRLRFIASNTASPNLAFDAGTINILYE